MKKSKRFLMTLLPSFFVLGMCLPALLNNKAVEDPGLDTAIYREPGIKVAHYDRPDILVGESSDDDDEEDVVEVDKVILHYYNEAGGCAGRAFYLWVNGVDGVEYNLDNAPDIMSVSEDGTMMTINIDFTDPRFVDFAGKSSLFFIVKFKMISPTNLNWGGQSDDMQLRYAEFPPEHDNKICEVWTMPAAGGGIAILDSEAKTKVHGVKLAKFTDWKTISCELTENTKTVNWKLYAFDETYFKIKPKKRADAQRWYLVKQGSDSGNFNITLKYEAHINMVYSLVSHDPESDSDPDMAALDKTVTIGFDNLYNTAKFHTYYEDKDANDNPKEMNLGVTYTPEETTFRVWSPISANMTVLIYDTDTSAEYGGEDKGKGYHMQYTSGGVWELKIKDLPAGKYYNYQVDNVLGTNVVMDPYATSAGACGVRGYIYDKDSAESKPTGWDDLPLRWDSDIDNPNKNTTHPELNLDTPQDLTIYEVHMQDFTGDASWESKKGNKRGTYNAFVESGTRLAGHADVTTGYDHLNELGVGAVQLVPVFDQDNDEVKLEDSGMIKYNWGYNPLNYNIVEGGYSSDPHDGLARVKEFRNLVLQMSKTDAHTRVIMDVVYNHVSSATGSNFHKLMPRYFFRYTADGELFDGSGCHNEVASERPMMRKFIVDSLCMWARDYKIKGFRFDLMGLIDFKTMIEVKKALYEIDPDIYIYGEGWSLGYNGPSDGNWGTETWQVYNECNNFKTTGVFLGGFNDCFRNAVRGENGWAIDGKTYPQAGFVQSGNWKQGNDGWYCDKTTLDKIADGLWGTNYNVNTNGEKSGYYPEQTVNYVSCHDNWTVRDQLFNTLPKRDDNHPASLESILRASLQAHTLVMAGNSAAFILGGEELLRTKEYPTSINPDAVSGVTADSWTEMWGHKISHNSYNAPIEVNSFKWGNKVKVECTTSGDTDELANETYHYVEAFATLIKSHKDLLKKSFDYSDKENNKGYWDFVSKTSVNEPVQNRYWSESDSNFSNCVGFQANEAFVYTCAGNVNYGDYIVIDGAAIDSWGKPVFEYGAYRYNQSALKDSNQVFFDGSNVVLYYDRHGKQEGKL